MTSLVPMTSNDFDGYIEIAYQEYASQKVKSGEWPQESALELSKQSFNDLLPKGIDTPNNYIFSIVDKEIEENVGILWFSVKELDEQKWAYIYDVKIYAQYRNQGYASKAFREVEHILFEMNIFDIRLHVFAHNDIALNLYKKLGYEPTNIFMRKIISSK